MSNVDVELKKLEKADPLLSDNSRRWVLFPTQYHVLYKMYKQHVASFWTVEEIDLMADAKDWEMLSAHE